jgi:DNA polymerase III epsilon subunit-like protein
LAGKFLAKLRRFCEGPDAVIVFDTETTGLIPKPGSGGEHPRLLELSVYVSSGWGKPPLEQWSQLVLPEGWEVPGKITQLTGVSHEGAVAGGVPVRGVLERFNRVLEAYPRAPLVGHNVEFDIKMLVYEMGLAGVDDGPLVGRGLKRCTMKAGTYVCKLPHKNPAALKYSPYKSPRLGELYGFLFGNELDGAHRAGVDTGATARCYFTLRDLRGAFELADAAEREWREEQREKREPGA